MSLSTAMLSVTLCFVALFASTAYAATEVSAPQESIVIIRNGDQPSAEGSDSYFTGSVRIDQPFHAYNPARTSGAYVTFEPGARTAWHTHPLGQTILIAEGYGLVQEEGGPVEEVCAGDIVWFPPNVKHWHGASSSKAMKHLALAEEQDGKAVTWMEKVSDNDYTSEPANGTSTSIRVTRNSDLASVKGGDATFSGQVRVDGLFNTGGESRSAGGTVTFSPGARTAWHTHPLGQTLIITSGVGLVQQWGGPILEVREGDVVWFPAGLKHWHGASATIPMTHISIAEELDGKATDWLEKVTEEQYSRLTKRQAAIGVIGALTAKGDVDSLKNALVHGLEVGLTVNEIKEVLIQLYAYAGFPRALNGTVTFMNLMKEREAAGINDTVGAEPSRPIVKDQDKKYDQGMQVLMQLAAIDHPLPKGESDAFNPTLEVFLKEHLFADIFSRDNLDYLNREIATVGALSALEGTNAQLQFHMGAAMNVGLTETQARELTAVIGKEVSKKDGDNALGVLEKVLSARNQ